MKIKRAILAPVLVATLGIASGGWLLQRGVDPQQNVYFQARLLEDVVQKVANHFVVKTQPEKLYRLAIDGMLEELGDPHSVFMTPKDVANLRLQTQGEYGGLGIEIDIRDGWLTVISPLPNSPAEKLGLQPGDRIIQVDSQSTRGWTTDKAVSELRGPKGSTVHILVSRLGIQEPIPFDVTRAEIEITAVPSSFMLNDHVGYVELTVFSETATDSLRAAIDRLRNQGAKSLVLDMRRNSGGLLDQGMSVADLFLAKRQLIVETRGRTPEQNRVSRATHDDEFPGLTVAVLIGQRSASATEIVAGALQDHDRAVLVGQTSFGKGSVQTLYELPGNNILKLTTARWYTPSGRSIQKPYGIGAESEESASGPSEPAPSPDEAAPAAAPGAQDKEEDNAPIYHTDMGREVLGGGGITPDLVVLDTLSTPVQKLVQAVRDDVAKFNNLRYRYAVEYAHDHPALKPGFPVTPQMLAGFYTLLQKEGLHLDRTVYDNASQWMGQQLAYDISTAKFSRQAAWKRLLSDDPQLKAAEDLLESATSTKDIFAELPGYAKQHGLTLGAAWQLSHDGRMPANHP